MMSKDIMWSKNWVTIARKYLFKACNKYVGDTLRMCVTGRVATAWLPLLRVEDIRIPCDEWIYTLEFALFSTTTSRTPRWKNTFVNAHDVPLRVEDSWREPRM